MSTERFTTEGNIVFCDGAKIAKAYRLGDDSTRWSEANATRIAAALNAAEDDGWVAVRGYEGKYEVSRDGRIRKQSGQPVAMGPGQGVER